MSIRNVQKYRGVRGMGLGWMYAAIGIIIIAVLILPALAQGVSLNVPATVTVMPMTYEIPLERKWNLISPIMRPMDDGTNRTIGLRRGLNLIGYSSELPLLWDDVIVSDGTDEYSVYEASQKGWLQRSICYYDNGWKFVPGSDDYLREANGYWILVWKDNLKLIFPEVGGSFTDLDFRWLGANVTNGIVVKTITQARNSGWILLSATYFDEDMQRYRTVPRHDENVHPWRGYWIFSRRKGLSLLLES